MNDTQYVPTVARSKRNSVLGHVFPGAVVLFAPGCLVLTVCLLVREIGAAEAASRTNGALTSIQRLEREHLQATHEARLRFERERHPVLSHGVYEDFRAIVHAHAE